MYDGKRNQLRDLLLLLILLLAFGYGMTLFWSKSSGQKGGCAALCMLPLALL